MESLPVKKEEGFRFELVNPATGEVMEYRGEPASVFGFLDDIEKQLRELKRQLKDHFEYSALQEKVKGLLNTNTFRIPGEFGDVKVELYQKIEMRDKLVERLRDIDPGRAEKLIRTKVSYELVKNEAKKVLATVDDGDEVKRILEDLYSSTPFQARASFEPRKKKAGEEEII